MTLNLADPVHPTFTAPDVDCDDETLTFELVVSDGSNNSAPDAVSVHVTNVDTQPPTMQAPAGETVECGAVPPPAEVLASDDCDPNPSVAFAEVLSSGACPNSYTLTRTWTATDDCMNSSQVSQLITVVDSTPPTLEGVPEDAMVDCTPAPPPIVTASDNCGDPNTLPVVTFDEQMSPLGVPGYYQLLRTWTATDACGNQAIETQTITVGDSEPLAITCPADVITGHDGPGDTAVVLGTPTTNDACGFVTLSNDAPAGSAFAVGETFVTWTADDGFGGVAQCTQKVTITNQPPQAVFSIGQITNFAAFATVQLDGTDSSDPDDNEEDLTFLWTIDSSVVACQGSSASCGLIEIPLSYGSHTVTLRVTDPYGAFDERTQTIVIDSGQLAVLDVCRGRVRFEGNPRTVRLQGQIGLPMGVNYTELSPTATALIKLAGVTVLPETSVPLQAAGCNDQQWRLDAPGAAQGVHRFRIDWDGASFRYRKNNFPIELSSDMITSTETLLELKLTPKKLKDPFTLDIGGLAQVSFGPGGQVVSSSVPFEVSGGGKRIMLTLPFPLVETTQITFSGGLSKVIYVGDDLTPSVGRFLIEARFAPSLMPDGVNSAPRTVQLNLSVGSQGLAGQATVEADDIKAVKKQWRIRACNDECDED